MMMVEAAPLDMVGVFYWGVNIDDQIIVLSCKYVDFFHWRQLLVSIWSVILPCFSYISTSFAGDWPRAHSHQRNKTERVQARTQQERNNGRVQRRYFVVRKRHRGPQEGKKRIL